MTVLWVVLGAFVLYAIWVAAIQDATVGDGGTTSGSNAEAASLLDPRAQQILDEDAGYDDFHDPRNPEVKREQHD